MKVEIAKGLKLDVGRLVETRLLIQASSGGGSYSLGSSSYTNAVSKLSSLQLITREAAGQVKLNEEILEL